MKPYERFINRLNGKPVDKIPNFCILMQFAAQYCDIVNGHANVRDFGHESAEILATK